MLSLLYVKLEHAFAFATHRLAIKIFLKGRFPTFSSVLPSKRWTKLPCWATVEYWPPQGVRFAATIWCARVRRWGLIYWGIARAPRLIRIPLMGRILVSVTRIYKGGKWCFNKNYPLACCIFTHQGLLYRCHQILRGLHPQMLSSWPAWRLSIDVVRL